MTQMKQNAAMEQKVCIVTGKLYETNAILLNKYPVKNPSDEKYIVTGMGICPEEQKFIDDGYIILVGIDESKSILKGKSSGVEKVTPENAYRTGIVVRLKKEVAKNLFNVPMENVSFIGAEVVDYLHKLQKDSEEYYNTLNSEK